MQVQETQPLFDDQYNDIEPPLTFNNCKFHFSSSNSIQKVLMITPLTQNNMMEFALEIKSSMKSKNLIIYHALPSAQVKQSS